MGPLGTNFSAVLIEIHTFSFKKMHFQMSSAKWRLFWLGLNVLISSQRGSMAASDKMCWDDYVNCFHKRQWKALENVLSCCSHRWNSKFYWNPALKADMRSLCISGVLRCSNPHKWTFAGRKMNMDYCPRHQGKCSSIEICCNACDLKNGFTYGTSNESKSFFS